ncbi:MAG: hypothetical protein U9P49_09735 [Thermodesulfobacteriota bacterium]|nr:hypothetical protein [Thermodesulfobacteriota bacterium]
MLKTPEKIRTLQRKLYRKAKQEPDYSEMGDSACLTMNNIGKPYAGKPHVRFDEGGQAEWPALYSTGFSWIIKLLAPPDKKSRYIFHNIS